MNWSLGPAADVSMQRHCFHETLAMYFYIETSEKPLHENLKPHLRVDFYSFGVCITSFITLILRFCTMFGVIETSGLRVTSNYGFSGIFDHLQKFSRVLLSDMPEHSQSEKLITSACMTL